MENFSNNPTKKRGRPCAGGEEYRAYMRVLYPEGGKRTVANRIYHQRAYKWLHDNPGLEWLFELDPQGDFKRNTLLCEIGRLPFPEIALEVATQLCKDKPKTKEGIVVIRAYRLALTGKPPALAGDPRKLLIELARTVEDFTFRYPQTDKAAILSAIDALRGIVEKHD